mgnify:CR=1 FL=1
MKFIGDKIAIGEIPAADIAAKFGTPTYVYDEQKIRKNYRRAFNAFAKHYPDFKMFYAVKSCNNPAIVNILRQEGAGVDAASVNEILLAKHSEFGVGTGVRDEFADIALAVTGIDAERKDFRLLEKAAELTAKMFRSKVAEYGLKPPQLKMEPARYFVGNAGYLIGRVHSIKESYKKIAGL